MKPTTFKLSLVEAIDITRGVRERADPNTPENRWLRSEFIRTHAGIASGEVYAEGRRARENGQPIGACPYIRSAYEREEWCAGWHGAGSKWAAQEAA